MKLDKTLYRDPENGKVAGVCAGIGEYFGIETWLVRILTVTGFVLLAGPFMLVAYVACWFILDKKPISGQAASMRTFSTAAPNASSGKGWVNETEQEKPIEVKAHVWQAGEPPKQAFHDIQMRFRKAEERLRKVETYVTSKEFQLNRELSRL
ncbi:envelope stress response membrane protein PspC [Alteromonas sp. ASW11-36]|uniref:Envelope stress response membrane protein PspC n=1 Tax=Alteromonas arenosi TaxID=3055817 RepID=A0ABT7SV63_9ALTE|nr:envelope stress response membrane protein PspC [Alteromonas sp. ASW11-36]MDM7860080.1 envelope stress response membrane protein PspC [Alteromonas sp. ASW11-36]